jgi:hypothetical protein
VRASSPGSSPGAGRLFDQLLVVALHGAVALAQVHHVAVLVGHELHLHVAATLDELLEVDAVVGEAGQRLGLRRRRRRPRPRRRARDAHAAPAAAALGLEQHGVAHLGGHALGVVGVGQDALAAGDEAEAGLAHGALGRRLLAHELHHGGGGPMKVTPCAAHRPAKTGFSERKPQPGCSSEQRAWRAPGPRAARPGSSRSSGPAEDHHLAPLGVGCVTIRFGDAEHGGDAEGVAVRATRAATSPRLATMRRRNSGDAAGSEPLAVMARGRLSLFADLALDSAAKRAGAPGVVASLWQVRRKVVAAP